MPGAAGADALLGVALSVWAERVLAVTDVDLYADDLNFVFGIAQPSGKAGIILLFRLHLDADEQRFRGRALKEAMRGHTFGVGHCTDPSYVMWFSYTLEETDRKGAAYYTRCKEGLRLANQFDITCATVHLKTYPAEGILQAAKERGCDLIVMASHGRRGFTRLLLGSQAMRVLTGSRVPVLVYR